MTNEESLDKGAPPKAWSIVETAQWALLALFFSFIPVHVALRLWTWIGGATLDWQDFVSNGPLVSLTTLVSAAVQVPIWVWAAQARGWRAADYLGWVVPKPRDVAVTLGVYVALMLAFNALDYRLDRSVSSFQINTYRSAREAGGLVTMWIAFVVGAPLKEELMFRGFLYRGWARSPRAVVPAVVVISALWAIAHVQYDWFLILYLLLHGLMLGWARWYSGSTMLTFAIHAFTNAWAMVQTAVGLT
jgi:membrane protease YdiL (CAAX protease family)